MRSLLARIERKLDRIIETEEKMSAELDALTAEIARSNKLAAQAVAALDSLRAQVIAAATDPAALTALAASLKAEDDAMDADLNPPAPVPAPPATP